ncbi:FRG domain-containing protein [Wenzhouxiangella sp. EGI_FJ10305]|uniref:FRG domain-containing protein n=1 Tax=Wenzhouxiangella sp. EGI_FJ10305 TaxID=3243768 RepID=UPI0035DA53E0
MKTIGQSSLESYCPDEAKFKARRCADIRKGNAIEVSDFLHLSRLVAELQYRNPGHVLMMRGQSDDYSNRRKNSSLKPSIFRGKNENPDSETLKERYETLAIAEQSLVEAYSRHGFPRAKEIKRRQVLRWTILQHYEICLTPLLDVTNSLRVAASFASDHSGEVAYLMVIGIPNVAGAITTSIEAELQVIRLASVSPPQALRPHIQEGFLVGEYPDIAMYGQKQLYEHHEVDFGLRLMAKFVFNRDPFWKNKDFPPIPHSALYPNDNDEFYRVAQEIKADIGED